MSAPDELRQLADRLDAVMHPEIDGPTMRAAAVALRHHANLTDENERLRELCGFLIDACATHRIDVPIHSSLLDLAVDIAGGAVSPPPAPTTLTGDCSIDCLERCAYPGIDSACEIGAPPAPTTCPTCRSDDPAWRRPGGEPFTEGDSTSILTDECWNSWHQAAT